MRDYAKTKNLLLVIYACTIIHEHFKLGRRWCSMTINGQDCYYNFVMSYNKIYYVCNKNCYDCNNICYGTYITILISVMRSLSIWSGWIYMHIRMDHHLHIQNWTFLTNWTRYNFKNIKLQSIITYLLLIFELFIISVKGFAKTRLVVS